jgi:acetyl-CoA acetyltransferase
MSEQMIKSICKSKAYGETAERTAQEHGCTVEEVYEIWKNNTERVDKYTEIIGGGAVE